LNKISARSLTSSQSGWLFYSGCAALSQQKAPIIEVMYEKALNHILKSSGISGYCRAELMPFLRCAFQKR